MARMTTKDVISAIYSDLERASDYATTQLREIRRKSWDRHLARKRGDEIAGRSRLLDTSIADTTEAIMAIISESWDTENICDFSPQGPDDIDQADAEARALNTQFWSNENGYLECTMAAKNALMFRNGILKCWLDRTPDIEVRVFPDRAALAAIPDDLIIDEVETDEGTRVTLELPQQKLVFKAIEPAYFFIDPNQDSNDMQSASFMAERVFFTRSELREMGISKKQVDDLPASPDESVSDTIGTSNTDITAKFIDGQNDKGNAATHDQDKIECYWVHMKMDRDGDGIAEKWRFLVSHRNLLLDDTVTHYPYATGCPWMVPNRWSGLSVYDKLKQTENARTNAYRQMSDNMNQINNPRPAADPGMVEFSDLLSAAPGRPIRKKQNDAMIDWQPVMDIVSNSLAFLQYTESVRSEQAGSSLDMQSADAQSVKNISGISAELQLGPAEQMTGMIARNLANTLLKNIFLVAHRIMREQWQGPVMFHKAGEWQETNPSDWIPRKRIHLNLAMSPGESRRKVAALDGVIQMQMALIQGGAANITVNWSGLHKALVDKMRLQRLDDTEGYFIDPDSQESQQAQQIAAQQAQQQAAIQAEAMGRQLAIEEFKAQDDSQQWQAELQHKYYDTNVDADIEEAKIVQAERTSETGNGTDRDSGSPGAGQG